MRISDWSSDVCSSDLWAFDRDPNAIAEGRALEDGSDGRLTLIHDRFSNMVSALGARGVAEVDAVTFDIGVSSLQLDRAERGFSFPSDGPPDLRAEGAGPGAAEIGRASGGERGCE